MVAYGDVLREKYNAFYWGIKFHCSIFVITKSIVNDKHGNSSTEHLIVNQLFHPNASLPPVVSAYGVYFFNTIETLNTIDKVKHHIGEKWSQQEEYEENIYATYLGGSQ